MTCGSTEFAAPAQRQRCRGWRLCYWPWCLGFGLLGPGLIAFGLAATKIGPTGPVTAIGNVATSTYVPHDWPVLENTITMSWFGLDVVKSVPAPSQTPGQNFLGQLDVAQWTLQAGWPLRCLQTCWLQDDRIDLFGSGSPFQAQPVTATPKGPLLLQRLGTPYAIAGITSARWIPVHSLWIGYTLNSLMYFVVAALGVSLLRCDRQPIANHVQ